jgi:hypothetical protein
VLTKQTWWIAGVGALLLAFAVFRWQDGVKIQHAADLAAQAQTANAEIRRVQGLADELTKTYSATVRVNDSLKNHDAALGRALAASKLKTPPMPPGPVPDSCGPYAARAQTLTLDLQIAEDQLVVKQERIDTLTAQGGRKDGVIAQQKTALTLAEAALKPHEKVVLPSTGHKLFGLIPMPELVVGVVGVYSGGKVYAGPGASFGFRIPI